MDTGFNRRRIVQACAAEFGLAGYARVDFRVDDLRDLRL